MQADRAGRVEDFMNGRASIPTLRIGLIGSGFIANFHLQALLSVRHVTVSGVYSPSASAIRFRRAIVLGEVRLVLGVGLMRSDADVKNGSRAVMPVSASKRTNILRRWRDATRTGRLSANATLNWAA
jgi:ornithine cyclodeaminase/alanine dehydrogenase-like protein (mu-crystallin family)